MQLSDNVQKIKPSGIRKYFDILESMPNAISLGVGEPDFVTPVHIRRAAIDALIEGHCKYTPNAGLTVLREEISKYLKRRFDIEYDPETEIFVTVGGSEAIDLAFRAILNPGDEVLIPEPSFVCYDSLTQLYGGVAKFIPTVEEDKFKLTPERLLAAITPKSKMLILPYPCNPTGGVMTKEDLLAIADILKEHDIIVLTDEIYAELSFGIKHFSIANIPELRDRIIYVNGFSKAYSMTGWRMGYVCAPAEALAAMKKIHQYAIMSAPTISQYGAIEACRNGDADIEQMRDEYDKRRKYIVKRFNDMGLTCFEPEGAFYCFPCIKSTGMTSEEFCDALLDAEQVACIPGGAFGPSGEGYVRCCYAASVEKLKEACDRIEHFLSKLKKKK